jgi:hypothetical protein
VESVELCTRLSITLLGNINSILTNILLDILSVFHEEVLLLVVHLNLNEKRENN